MADRRKEGRVLVGREGTTCLRVCQGQHEVCMSRDRATCLSWGQEGGAQEHPQKHLLT